MKLNYGYYEDEYSDSNYDDNEDLFEDDSLDDEEKDFLRDGFSIDKDAEGDLYGDNDDDLFSDDEDFDMDEIDAFIDGLDDIDDAELE